MPCGVSDEGVLCGWRRQSAWHCAWEEKRVADEYDEHDRSHVWELSRKRSVHPTNDGGRVNTEREMQ